MVTIRRNKYGKIAYATQIFGSVVTGWSPDEAAAIQIDDATAKKVTDAFESRGGPTGQIAVLDAKGKTQYLWGDPGEEPKPTKPPASLPDIASRIDLLEERVDLIEKSGDPSLSPEDVASLKSMLGEWSAYKESEAKRAKGKPAPSPTEPSGAAATVKAG